MKGQHGGKTEFAVAQQPSVKGLLFKTALTRFDRRAIISVRLI